MPSWIKASVNSFRPISNKHVMLNLSLLLCFLNLLGGFFCVCLLLCFWFCSHVSEFVVILTLLSCFGICCCVLFCFVCLFVLLLCFWLVIRFCTYGPSQAILQHKLDTRLGFFFKTRAEHAGMCSWSDSDTDSAFTMKPQPWCPSYYSYQTYRTWLNYCKLNLHSF